MQNKVLEQMGIDLPDVSEHKIKSDLGRILKQLTKNGEIKLIEGMYNLNIPDKQEKLKQIFDSFNNESLVDKTISMLQEFYKSKGYKNLVGENIDGSNDGGIDGVIEAEDYFSYEEIIKIQVKYKMDKNKNIPLCEIREFCGVLSADHDATKGIFVTNAKFTKETEKFAKKFKTKYFTLIDGEKWLKLADECNYMIDE